MAAVSTKEKALKAVEELPEEATLDDVIERLIFLRKIERGLSSGGRKKAFRKPK